MVSNQSQSKWLLPIVAVFALLLGVGMFAGPPVYDAIAASVSAGDVVRAAIVYESSDANATSKATIEVLAKAASVGVLLIDQNDVGPGKKPSALIKPFLDAAAGHALPALAIETTGGKLIVEPCPTTFAAVKERVGK